MVIRALALAAGLTGAAGFSQFPEFSQQYVQRLGGAVDELSRVIGHFDRDAATVGLTRQRALEDLAQGGGIGAARSESMSATIARRDRLAADLAALEGAGPFTRARLATHLSDRDIARRTLAAFEPALPATAEGGVFAAAGFLTGWAGFRLVAAGLARVARRRASGSDGPRSAPAG